MGSTQPHPGDRPARRLALAAFLAILAVAAAGSRAADPPRPADEANLPGLVFHDDLVLGEDPGEAGLLLDSVSCVVEDSAGNLFVCDARVPCVYKLDAAGVLLARFGEAGQGPEDLREGAQLAIDPAGRILVAGQGADVHLMDGDWNYLGGFQRQNPADRVGCLAVAGDGAVYLAVANPRRHTTIDRYDADFTYLGSFSPTFIQEEDDPLSYEAHHAGGDLAVTADGRVFFLQQAPYELREYSAAGELLASTDDGGAVLTSSSRRRDQQTTSLFCLYDEDLRLTARAEFAGFIAVRGRDAQGRVFLFCREDDRVALRRCRLEPSP